MLLIDDLILVEYCLSTVYQYLEVCAVQKCMCDKLEAANVPPSIPSWTTV